MVVLQAMSAAANYAWVNRSSMTFLTRQAFAKATWLCVTPVVRLFVWNCSFLRHSTHLNVQNIDW